ncbi:tripartite motif-containing protein 2 isoform X2 [Trichomycterus rosablanca]|uniref:tripartite motif-containing protein 2 isoform X2 n=1 Tax=Trichomycterus rosablanca TaxID=2290929 RepID=UPI002F353905
MEVLRRTRESESGDEELLLESISVISTGEQTEESCPNHAKNVRTNTTVPFHSFFWIRMVSPGRFDLVWFSLCQVMEFYCPPCETAMCEECSSKEHAKHPTVPLRDVLHQHRTSLQQQLNLVKQRLPEIDSALLVVSEILQQLTNQKSRMERKIHSTFDDVQKVLEVRRSVLLMELEVNHALKYKVLQNQLASLLQERESMQSGCGLAERALAGSSEVLLSEKQLSERLSELASRDLPLRPEENAQLGFGAETDGLCDSIRRLGTVATGSASACRTVASGEGLRRCVPGQPTSVTVTAKDRDGTPCRAGRAALSAELRGTGGAPAGEARVTEGKDGTYEVLYTLEREGQYTLALRLHGQHILGSPFSVRAVKDVQKRVYSPGVCHAKHSGAKCTAGTGRKKENPAVDDLLFRIGSKGRNKGEFANLQGVAASSSGKILIADSNNQCVQVFSDDGQFRSRFGIRGRSPGQLQRPTGIAAHPSGDVVVADYDNKWVSVFSSDGKFKNKIGSGKLMGPKGVTVDRSGNIIVVDNKACCVFVFQPDGRLVRRFGSRGNGDRQFAGPHFAAVNQNNEIILSDFHNHSVKVFNAEGEFLLKFGTSGKGNGQFNAPTGVAVDSNDNIIVADWGNSRIQVFDSNGSFLSCIDTSADPLYGPQGLALTPGGRVVVADSGNHCFKVYRYL